MKYLSIVFGLATAFGILQHQAKAQQKDSCKNLLVTYDTGYKRIIRAPGDTISLALDIYNCNKISKGKHPAIIFVHGGGFWEGDKRNAVYVKMASAFAAHGYIAFSVNYRLKDKDSAYSKRVLDTCISDVMAAVRWIRAHGEQLGVDTSTILICGDSAGGGIVVNTCYDPAYHSYFTGCIDLWGGLPGEHGWDAPIFTVLPNSQIPPTCMIHGTADRIIPYTTSERLANELTAGGIYNELHPLNDADHYPVQLAEHFIPLMISFADKVIKKK